MTGGAEAQPPHCSKHGGVRDSPGLYPCLASRFHFIRAQDGSGDRARILDHSYQSWLVDRLWGWEQPGRSECYGDFKQPHSWVPHQPRSILAQERCRAGGLGWTESHPCHVSQQISSPQDLRTESHCVANTRVGESTRVKAGKQKLRPNSISAFSWCKTSASPLPAKGHEQPCMSYFHSHTPQMYKIGLGST